MFGPETRILVADDMKVMRLVLSKLLTELGFRHVTLCKDGQEAWQHLEKAASGQTTIELVISDWNMPKLLGIDLLRQVRMHPKLKNMPFVMITAEVEEESLEAANAATHRVSAFLGKPIDKKTLADALKKAYGQAQKAA